MKPYTLHMGDCLESLRAMPSDSVDAIVTDPPYGLSFMGKRWDYDVPGVEVWAECVRVLKPGGYLLAFAGTRTQHRMAVRIEDAGFEIRDMIAWVYGSGFPKSHNGPWGGTALKPALEPITMARKPLAGTVEANWREHGTGALNIDGCRVGTSVETWPTTRARPANSRDLHHDYTGSDTTTVSTGEAPAGRWPANLIHDGSDEVVAAFPQTGPSKAAPRGSVQRYDPADTGAKRPKGGNEVREINDAGGSAARFFYCPKASKSERGEGNSHPTVKPVDLMRYLCRLVTPPGGAVLDPFMGSGSTGKAAMLEGFRFIGCELSPEYLDIAQARIEAASQRREAERLMPQLDLFGEAA